MAARTAVRTKKNSSKRSTVLQISPVDAEKKYKLLGRVQLGEHRALLGSTVVPWLAAAVPVALGAAWRGARSGSALGCCMAIESNLTEGVHPQVVQIILGGNLATASSDLDSSLRKLKNISHRPSVKYVTLIRRTNFILQIRIRSLPLDKKWTLPDLFRHIPIQFDELYWLNFVLHLPLYLFG